MPKQKTIPELKAEIATEEVSISNPRFHVMCPIRPIKPDGKWGNKQRREYC